MPRDDLAELAGSTGFPRISIYMPTHKTFPDADQDPIRFSNALKNAEQQLDAADVRNAGARPNAIRRAIIPYKEHWPHVRLARDRRTTASEADRDECWEPLTGS